MYFNYNGCLCLGQTVAKRKHVIYTRKMFDLFLTELANDAFAALFEIETKLTCLPATDVSGASNVLILISDGLLITK